VSVGHAGRVSFEGLRPVTGASVGAWILPRLRGFGGRVDQVVPDGFEAYARLLHPAADEDGAPVTWAEVCRRQGRTAHALMQWQSIAGVTDHLERVGRWPRKSWVSERTSQWPGHEPEEGRAPADLLSEALQVLSQFTADSDHCFHAVWEGWGWLHENAQVRLHTTDQRGTAPSVPVSHPLPAELLEGARLQHPGRDYLLFEGPLLAALRIGPQEGADSFSLQSPNLLWPADQSWCLATEVDFDSTLIAGTRELIDALLRVPGLEAWAVEATDDLTVDGDLINRRHSGSDQG
jgi:hypothetical protein